MQCGTAGQGKGTMKYLWAPGFSPAWDVTRLMPQKEPAKAELGKAPAAGVRGASPPRFDTHPRLDALPLVLAAACPFTSPGSPWELPPLVLPW